jgi:autotransporter-associated beta strand protein
LVEPSGAGTATLSGPITRKMNLTVNGGALTLSGVNTFTGAITVGNKQKLLDGGRKL